MNDQAVAAASAGSAIFVGIFVLIGLVLGIVIYWKIASKAGYSGAMGLLMLVPLVNLIVLLVFAFGEWPIQKELKRLKGESLA